MYDVYYLFLLFLLNIQIEDDNVILVYPEVCIITYYQCYHYIGKNNIILQTKLFGANRVRLG